MMGPVGRKCGRTHGSRLPGGSRLTLSLVLACPVTVAAQVSSVRGVVTDASTRAPLTGASVRLEGTGRAALTDGRGRYFLINVPPATYTLVAERIGYATARREGLMVPIGLSRNEDVALQPEAIALGEIRVEADRTPLVPEAQTGSLELITREQLRVLPATDVVDVLELTTGFLRVPEYSTALLTYNQRRQGLTSLRLRGGRSAETVFLIDGIPVSNSVLGGPTLDITNKAIEQLAVFKGQIDAQYGNALSGVVAYATPDGGTSYAGEVELTSAAPGGWLGSRQDALRDFDMIEGFLSGPVPGTGERLRLFAAGRQRYGADRVLEFDGVVFDPSNPSDAVNPPEPLDVLRGWRALGFDEQRDVYSKLTFRVTPSAKATLAWIGYERNRKPFDFQWLLAGVDPLPEMRTRQDSSFYTSRPHTLEYLNLVQSSVRLDRSTWILRWDHTLERSAYNMTVGFLDQRRTTCNVVSGVCLDHRFQPPILPTGRQGFVHPSRPPLAYDNTPTPGTDVLWGGERLKTTTLRLDALSQAGEHHALSAGVFAQFHDLDYDEWEQPFITTDSAFHQVFVASPWEAAFYVQHLIEYDFLTVKLGARLEHGQATGRFFADPLDPTHGTTAFDVCRDPQSWQNVTVRTWDPETGTERVETLSADPGWTLQGCVNEVREEAARIATSDDFGDAKPRTVFSPRIGVNFPATASSNVFLNYGQYAQNPVLVQTLRNTGIGTPREGTAHGPAILDYALLGQGAAVPFIGNPALRSERTTMYEVGFTQVVGETYAIQAVAFGKDQAGLAGVAVVGSPPHLVHDPGLTYGTSAPRYAVMTNRDFATTRGIELQLRRRLQDHWGFHLSYGFSSCRANAVEPDREAQGRVEENDPDLRRETQCDVDRTHEFSGVLAMVFTDDTPGWAPWAGNASISIVGRAASGLPYTPAVTFDGLGDLGQLDRNSARAPATWQVDLQFRKDWRWKGVQYGLVVEALNVTDRKNCIQVFETSGDCRGGADDLDRRRFAFSGDVPPSTALDRPQFMGTRRTLTAGLRVSF